MEKTVNYSGLNKVEVCFLSLRMKVSDGLFKARRDLGSFRDEYNFTPYLGVNF